MFWACVCKIDIWTSISTNDVIFNPGKFSSGNKNVCQYNRCCFQTSLTHWNGNVVNFVKFYHWLHLRLSFCQRSVPSVTKNDHIYLNFSVSICRSVTLQCCYNERHTVSNHRRLGCLLTRLFRRRSRAFVRGVHRWSADSPHEGPATRKMFSFDDVIMKLLYMYVVIHVVLTVIVVALKGHHCISFSSHYINFDLCEKKLYDYVYIIIYTCIHNYLACIHNYLYMYTSLSIHVYIIILHVYIIIYICIYHYLACIHN